MQVEIDGKTETKMVSAIKIVELAFDRNLVLVYRPLHQLRWFLYIVGRDQKILKATNDLAIFGAIM